MADAGPLGPLFKPMLGPCLRSIYRAGLARKNARFDMGQGVTTFDRPVISVGNLSVGGTGKTPMVEMIVRVLLDSGRTPCIAMRGYKSRSGRSDEADSYRAALPDIHIVAQPDRASGLRKLLATPEGNAIDTIVLDDGFQHRQIARDLDIVLIDATRSPFDDHLLPMGWLRETPDALARADAVIVTHADQVAPDACERLAGQILDVHNRPPLAFTSHAWRSIHSSESNSPEPVESLRGHSVLLVCAIGNPRAFLDQARRLGVDVVESMFLRDHDPYTAGTITRIHKRLARLDVAAIFVTGKDWAKLSTLDRSRWPIPVLYPRLDIEFSSGRSAFEAALQSAINPATPPQA